MNWTEGSLARHSRGKQQNQLLLRQRQHFAKVRGSQLHNDVKRSPITISFLGREHTGNPWRQAKAPSISTGRYSSPPKHKNQHSRGHKRPEESLQSDLKTTPLSRGHTYGSRFKQRGKQPSPEASLLLVDKKRSRAALGDGTNSAQHFVHHEKKRRLLREADWAGLNMQQPLEMKFPEFNTDGSKWGKMNKIEAGRIGPHKHCLDEIPSGGPIWGAKGDPSSATQHSEGHPLRIRIGSLDVQPSGNTTSQSSKRRCSIGPRPLCSSSTQLTSITSPVPSQTCQHHAPHSVAENKLNFPPSGRFKSRDRIQSSKGPSDHAAAHRSRDAHMPRYAYASSVIHEPIPRRNNGFTVLEWSPSKSERSDSLEVQIGQINPVVMASQRAENELWKKCLLSSDEDNVSITQGNLHTTASARPTISPGISAILPQSKIALPAPNAISRGSSPGSPANLTQQLSGASHAGPSSATHLAGKNTTICEEAKQGNRNEQNLASVTPVQNTQPRTAEEEDDAWLKFVFGSDDDQIRETAIQDAAQKAICELKSSDIADSHDNLSLVNNVSSDEGTSPDDDTQDFQTTAAYGTTAPDSDTRISGLTSSSPDTSNESHAATQGTLPPDLDHIHKIGTSTSIDNSSSYQHTEKSGFRFSAPKAFVGKSVGSKDNEARPASLWADTRAKGKGRRKKRALDGRPDLRGLPDFNDDPIEE